MNINQFESDLNTQIKKLKQTKQSCDIFVVDKKSLIDQSLIAYFLIKKQ
jgi:hypothetical protein